MEDRECVNLLKQIAHSIANDNSEEILLLLQGISNCTLPIHSPLVIEFFTLNNYQFIRDLHSLITSPTNVNKTIKILCIQILISLCKYCPPISIIISQQNALYFIYNELLYSTDDIIQLELMLLSEVCSVPLPPDQVEKLEYNLLEKLIEFIVKRPNDDPIQSQALAALLRISCQFNSHSFEKNRVLESLYEHPSKSELGQQLISALNLANPADLYFICKIIQDILNNFALAEKFFYSNDLKILLDIIIRELNDLPLAVMDDARRNLLDVLAPFISNTNFRREPHRIDEVIHTLQQFIEYKDCLLLDKAKILIDKVVELKKLYNFEHANKN